MKRAALYGRVSTKDRGQDPERQLREMCEFAKYRKWKIVTTLDDHMTGKRTDRPGYKALWQLVRARKVDVVIVHEFSRFARSTIELLKTLEEFRALGVDFVSIKQQVDTTTPSGKLVFGVIALIAEFELEMTRERVLSALDLRKAKLREDGYFISSKSGRRCTTLGRPRVEADASEIAKLRANGCSWAEIASGLGISKDTCRRVALRGAKTQNSLLV
jgi:DNA invertase Pin-like site-specific DNA recombinase